MRGTCHNHKMQADNLQILLDPGKHLEEGKRDDKFSNREVPSRKAKSQHTAFPRHIHMHALHY